MEDFGSTFGDVPDPRSGNARHLLTDVLVIAFAATLCGAETCCDMALFGRAKESLLRSILPLPHGVPSHDTFSRVFRLLDSVAFEAAFRRFTAAFAARLSGARPGERIVAIDGKSVSAACEAGARATPLHLVTAWACEQRLVLALCRASGRRETQAALAVVALLDLEGTTVTADALHGSRRMAGAIRKQGGDYVLAIKGNRGPLHQAIRDRFAQAGDRPGQVSRERAHGRHEERRASILPAPPDWADHFGFSGLAALGRVETLRRDGSREQRTSRYFVLSRLLSPAELAHTVRMHWSIENRQHWLLDVVMDEDRTRSRKDHAGTNTALLRRLALNLPRTDPDKTAIRAKIKKAGWSDPYLLNLLVQMR